MMQVIRNLVLAISLFLARPPSAWSKEKEEERPDHFRIRNVTGLFGLPPFFVGSVHHDWVLSQEQGPLDVGHRAMANKRGKCYAIDVGMNDGFFTQFSAAHGCHVLAFEMQESCIAVSRNATAANGFDSLVTIIRAPVTDVNNKVMKVPRGNDDVVARCDGGYSVRGKSHYPYAVAGFHHFHTVALDSVTAPSTFVDFLKVDVEGHDPQVLQGAEELFRSHRIGRAVVEIVPDAWGIHFEDGIKIYGRILSYGYHVFCATERKQNNDWSVVQRNMTFEKFRSAAASGNCIDWEFYPS